MTSNTSKLKEDIHNLETDLNKPEIYQNYERASEIKKELENKRNRLNILVDVKDSEDNLKTNLSAINQQEHDPDQDPEFLSMLKEENRELVSQIDNLKAQLVETKAGDDINKIIIEIRAAAGGDESSIFAADLYRMYTRYIENKGWKKDIISSSKSNLGAVKEMVFEAKGDQIYEKLKGEMGVHRVQRIPVTEKKGRVHTSTATVAILPVSNQKVFNIDKKDLKMDFFCASGAGGQHVNKTASAVRITHIPTGIAVSSQNQRSQHQNRDKAMEVLNARLLEQKEKERSDKIDTERKSQIGTGDRSEKIKTYNFAQDRLTDHRIGKNYFGLKKIMDGDIDEMLNDYRDSISKETEE